MSATGDVLEAVQEELRAIREAQAQLAQRVARLDGLLAQFVATAQAEGEGPLDAEDLALLADEGAMGHIAAVKAAYERHRRGEDVDWGTVIREHIVH